MHLDRKIFHFFDKWRFNAIKLKNQYTNALLIFINYQKLVLKRHLQSWKIQTATAAFLESVEHKERAVQKSIALKAELERVNEQENVANERKSESSSFF
jgi:uncharacterized LabA/DUF88 family protein